MLRVHPVPGHPMPPYPAHIWSRNYAAPLCVAITLAFSGIANAEQKPALDAADIRAVTILSEPIPSFTKLGVAATVNTLDWRGGLVLTSPEPDFGGWSGLAIDATGENILAVSDAGHWLIARLISEKDRLAKLDEAKIGPILSLKKKSLKGKRDQDAEAIALFSGSLAEGEVLISFERNHRIGVFAIGPDGLSAPRRYLTLPKDTQKLSRNKGLEGLAVLRGGENKSRILAFAESLPDKNGNHSGWLWRKDKEPARLALTNPGEYEVTDLAALADGGVLVLERRYRWYEGVKMRLRHIEARDIAPGAVLVGTVLLDADQTQQIDNMEGLAVYETTTGETVVTLISDNNFNADQQRTVLLQFSWRREKPAVASEPMPEKQ